MSTHRLLAVGALVCAIISAVPVVAGFPDLPWLVIAVALLAILQLL